ARCPTMWSTTRCLLDIFSPKLDCPVFSRPLRVRIVAGKLVAIAGTRPADGWSSSQTEIPQQRAVLTPSPSNEHIAVCYEPHTVLNRVIEEPWKPAIGGNSDMTAQLQQCRPDVVVVGAGPSGLAVARELEHHHQISALVIDRAAVPAVSWRTRY